MLVEAALVLPMLLALVFGMIDFGVNLSDQISVREGVREGARQAVVSAPGASSIADVVDLTKERIGIDSAGTRVHVNPQGADSAAAGAPGSNLSVCAYVPMRSLSGLYSGLLDGRYMWSRVTMRVEQALTYTTPGGDAAPSGHSWAGCSADG